MSAAENARRHDNELKILVVEWKECELRKKGGKKEHVIDNNFCCQSRVHVNIET